MQNTDAATLVGMLFLGVGIVLAAFGLAGRPGNARVFCRRCRYPLTGGALRFNECPECGGDISHDHNLVWTYRHFRRNLIGAGATSLSFGALVLTPWSGLLDGAISSGLLGPRMVGLGVLPESQQVRIIEVARARLSDGQMSVTEAQWIARSLLDEWEVPEQLSALELAPPWSPEKGAFIERAHEHGVLHAEDADRYVALALSGVRVVTEPVLEPHGTILLKVRLDRSGDRPAVRLGVDQYRFSIRPVGVRLNGQPTITRDPKAPEAPTTRFDRADAIASSEFPLLRYALPGLWREFHGGAYGEIGDGSELVPLLLNSVECADGDNVEAPVVFGAIKRSDLVPGTHLITLNSAIAIETLDGRYLGVEVIHRTFELTVLGPDTAPEPARTAPAAPATASRTATPEPPSPATGADRPADGWAGAYRP